MHRPLALLVAAAIALAGCTRGDENSTPGTTTISPSDATPTTLAGPVAVDECEDAPDPAHYTDTQFPIAVRPCTVPAELVVHTIRDGVGRPAEPGDTMIVDFTGVRAETGEIFDTSFLRGIPFDFPLGRGGVIPGWDQGLVGARAGSLVKLDIPGDLAYGDNPPPGDLQPGDALSFVIAVRAVIPPVTAVDAPTDIPVEPSAGAMETTVSEVVAGDGAEVELGTTAVVHMLVVRGDNEVVLVNTWEADDPLQILMEEGQTLPGVFTGLLGARVGSVRVITMPPADAFGPDGEPSMGLPPGADVIVIAEVMGVY